MSKVVNCCCSENPALIIDSKVYVWGIDCLVPTLLNLDFPVAMVSSNCERMLIMGEDGSVWMRTKDEIRKIFNHGAKSIACGGNHLAVLFENEMLFVAKCMKDTNWNPIHLRVKKVCCGDGHIIVLTPDGKVFGWGNNSFHQLVGLASYIDEPKQVILPPVIDIGCGSFFSVAITESRQIYYWGDLGKDRPISKPQPVLDLFGASSVFCGGAFIIIQMNDGTFMSWGRDNPCPQNLAIPAEPIVSITCYKFFTIALCSSNRVYNLGSAFKSDVPTLLFSDEKVMKKCVVCCKNYTDEEECITHPTLTDIICHDCLEKIRKNKI